MPIYNSIEKSKKQALNLQFLKRKIYGFLIKNVAGFFRTVGNLIKTAFKRLFYTESD